MAKLQIRGEVVTPEKPRKTHGEAWSVYLKVATTGRVYVIASKRRKETVEA